MNVYTVFQPSQRIRPVKGKFEDMDVVTYALPKSIQKYNIGKYITAHMEFMEPAMLWFSSDIDAQLNNLLFNQASQALYEPKLPSAKKENGNHISGLKFNHLAMVVAELENHQDALFPNLELLVTPITAYTKALKTLGTHGWEITDSEEFEEYLSKQSSTISNNQSQEVDCDIDLT